MGPNEKRVRAVFPRATIERQVGPFGNDPYYLVLEESRAYLYIGYGGTKAQAWKSAAESGVVRDAETAQREGGEA